MNDCWRIYWTARKVLPRWLCIFIGTGIVAHLLMIGLGVWQLTRRGPEFVWAAPVPLHTIVPGLIYALDDATTTKFERSFKIWLASWAAVNFAASVVSMAAAGVQGGWLHLVQCLIGMVSIWVYLWRKWWMLRERKKSERPATFSTSYPAMDLGVSPRRMTGSTIEMGTKDLESGSLVWGGNGVSETGDRPSMESGEVAAARLGVMRPPHV